MTIEINKLTLVSTEDLVQEITNRYPTVVLAYFKEIKREGLPERVIKDYNFQGNFAQGIYLCEYLKLKIWEMEDSINAEMEE